ncbi:MAG: hypothetical protein ACXWUL_04555 [Caldimonas sp.]
MPCTETTSGRCGGVRSRAAAGAAALVFAACAPPSAERTPGEAADLRRPPATAPHAEVAASRSDDARPAAAGAGRVTLPPPRHSRNWAELRQQAAERIVAANPDLTYGGRVPEPLLAIPVLEIELNGDGSIRRIEVLREPRQAKDTLKIAADAVRRAAPFGDVSRLPRPWKFVETFLFDESRKFKPRTLDR